MPWGRVDDNHYDHPKVLALPRAIRNEAVGVYWRVVSRCNRTLSDGIIEEADLERVDASPEAVDALLAAGLFDRDKRTRMLRVHDYLDYNQSRAEVEIARHRKAEAGRAGGLASGRARAKQTGKQKEPRRRNGASTTPEAPASTTVEPPSRPVPSVLPPNPRPAGVRNGSPRANGTNPRALAEQEDEARRERARLRERAYQRHEITEAQLAEHRAADTVPARSVS